MAFLDFKDILFPGTTLNRYAGRGRLRGPTEAAAKQA
jgi:hypothetical protein